MIGPRCSKCAEFSPEEMRLRRSVSKYQVSAELTWISLHLHAFIYTYSHHTKINTIKQQHEQVLNLNDKRQALFICLSETPLTLETRALHRHIFLGSENCPSVF